MHEKTLEFSATDIANFLACHHLLTLDQAEVAGEIQQPFFDDAGVELLRKPGLEHEQTYLRHLAEIEGLQVAHIPTDIAWAEAVSRTIIAIREGAEAVYQATFQKWRMARSACQNTRDFRRQRAPRHAQSGRRRRAALPLRTLGV
jgi:hypothetical protein